MHILQSNILEKVKHCILIHILSKILNIYLVFTLLFSFMLSFIDKMFETETKIKIQLHIVNMISNNKVERCVWITLSKSIF